MRALYSQSHQLTHDTHEIMYLMRQLHRLSSTESVMGYHLQLLLDAVNDLYYKYSFAVCGATRGGAGQSRSTREAGRRGFNACDFGGLFQARRGVAEQGALKNLPRSAYLLSTSANLCPNNIPLNWNFLSSQQEHELHLHASTSCSPCYVHIHYVPHTGYHVMSTYAMNNVHWRVTR